MHLLVYFISVIVTITNTHNN